MLAARIAEAAGSGVARLARAATTTTTARSATASKGARRGTAATVLDSTVIHKPHVHPIKLRAWNPEWDVDVRRTVAYRGECECGWRGRSRATYADARADLQEHRRAT